MSVLTFAIKHVM